MPNWYAQYNDSDKKVTGVGFLSNPSAFDDATHGVSAAQTGEIPDGINITSGSETHQYNTETELVEVIP